MEINEKVQKFLDGVVEDNKKKLMGIAMDVGHYKSILAETDLAKFREDLSEEKAKYELNKKGKPSKFIGDKDKIKEYEAVIDKMEDIKLKISNLEAITHDVNKYIKYIQNVDDETIKNLNEASE